MLCIMSMADVLHYTHYAHLTFLAHILCHSSPPSSHLPHLSPSSCQEHLQPTDDAQPQQTPDTNGKVAAEGEGTGEKDMNKETEKEAASSSDSSDLSDDNDGPDEILIPEPGMCVRKY